MNLLISAGEASGDLHGARLLKELQSRRPGLTAFGMGGARLAEAGLDTVVRSESALGRRHLRGRREAARAARRPAPARAGGPVAQARGRGRHRFPRLPLHAVPPLEARRRPAHLLRQSPGVGVAQVEGAHDRGPRAAHHHALSLRGRDLPRARRRRRVRRPSARRRRPGGPPHAVAAAREDPPAPRADARQPAEGARAQLGAHGRGRGAPRKAVRPRGRRGPRAGAVPSRSSPAPASAGSPSSRPASTPSSRAPTSRSSPREPRPWRPPSAARRWSSSTASPPSAGPS